MRHCATLNGVIPNSDPPSTPPVLSAPTEEDDCQEDRRVRASDLSALLLETLFLRRNLQPRFKESVIGIPDMRAGPLAVFLST